MERNPKIKDLIDLYNQIDINKPLPEIEIYKGDNIKSFIQDYSFDLLNELLQLKKQIGYLPEWKSRLKKPVFAGLN